MLNNSRDVDPKGSNHGRSSKSFSRKGEICSSSEEKTTTNIKLKAKTKEPGNTNLNIRRDQSASDASIATEIEEASEKSNRHESFEEEIETGSYTSATSIAEEVSIKKGDFSHSHSYTSSLRSDDVSDATRSSSRGTSKTLDRFERRTNTNEINKNNNKSKNTSDEINKDSFGTSMVQIQLKEELAMQEHKLLLLEAKSKYLEESYRNELKELKQQLKNMKSDDAIEKLTKKKMKASLTYKMKKNELKRLMAAVHSSMDAQKMMMLEASSLHAKISTRNQVDKSFEGSEVSSPTISSSTEQSKHKEIKVIKSFKNLKDVKVKRADEGVSPTKSDDDDDDLLKNNKELFGNVGSVNINQSNHHQDLSGNAAVVDDDDGDDIEVIHSEVVSLDLKNLGSPVYEGSSIASKNISEEIPDNISTSYSASSSQSKMPDNSMIGKELNLNVNRSEAERCSTDVDINEEISYESSSKSSHHQSSRKSKSKPHEKFKEATNDGRKKKKTEDDDDYDDDNEQLNDVNFLKKTEREKNNGRDENEGNEDFESEPPKERDKLLENNGSENKTLKKLEHSLTELKIPPMTTSSEVTSESQDVYNESSFCSSDVRDDVKEDARNLTKSNRNKSDEENSSLHSSSVVDNISIKTNPSSFQVSTQNPLSNRKFSNPSLSSIILPPLDLDLLKRESNENKKNASTSQEAHKQLSNNSDQLKQQQQLLPKNAQLDSARTLDEIDEEFSWSEEISAHISDCHEVSTKNYGDIKIHGKYDEDDDDDDGANKMSSKSNSEGKLNVTEELRRPRPIDGNDGQLRVSDESKDEVKDGVKDGGVLDDCGMLSFETSPVLKGDSVQADNVNNIARKVFEKNGGGGDDDDEIKESGKIPISEEHNEEVRKHSDVEGESSETDGNMQDKETKDFVDKTSNDENKHDSKNRNFDHLLEQPILPQDMMEMQNIQNLGKSSDKNTKPFKSWKDSLSFKTNVLGYDDVNDVRDDDDDDDVDDFSEGTKTNVGQLGNQDMQQDFLDFGRNMKENNRIHEDGEKNIDGEDDEESDDEEEDEESDEDDDEEDIDSNNANSNGLAKYFNFNENSRKLLRPSAIIGRKTNDGNDDNKDKNADDNWLGSTKEEGLIERGTILNAQELFLNKLEDDFNKESKEEKHSEAKLHNLETVLPLSNDDDDDDDDDDNYEEDNDDGDESSEDGNIKAKETASDDDHSFESSSPSSATSSSPPTTSSSSSTARRDGDISSTKGSHSAGIALHKSQGQFFDKRLVTDIDDDVDEIVSEEIVAESDDEDDKENNKEMFGIKSFMDPTTLKDSGDSKLKENNVMKEVTNDEVKMATIPGRCGDNLETNTENQNQTDNEIINKHGVEYNEIRQKSISESDDPNFNESPINQIDHQTKKKESSERDECRRAEDACAAELEWKDFSSAGRESIGKQKGGQDFTTPDDDSDHHADIKSNVSSSDNCSENHASRELVENIDKLSQINVVKGQPVLEQCEESKECSEQRVKDVAGTRNSNKLLPSSMDDDSEKSDSPLLVIDGLKNYLEFESKGIQNVEGTHFNDFAAVAEHSADQDDGKDEGGDDEDDQPTEEDAESITNEAETSGDIPEEILEHSSHEVECHYDSPNKNKPEDENLAEEMEEVSDVESQSLLDLLDDLP